MVRTWSIAFVLLVGCSSSAGDPGGGGDTNANAKASAESSTCAGNDARDPSLSKAVQCQLARCCGSAYSCSKDSLCTSVFKCVTSTTSASEQTACMDKLEGTSNIASKLWFIDLSACLTTQCNENTYDKPPVEDPCTKNTTCAACVNAPGYSSNGFTGNCGWTGDGTCHAGSTKGPDSWDNLGGSSTWIFFDDSLCPGGGGGSGGCTADADCGHCERCERSTGKCLTKAGCS